MTSKLFLILALASATYRNLHPLFVCFQYAMTLLLPSSLTPQQLTSSFSALRNQVIIPLWNSATHIYSTPNL